MTSCSLLVSLLCLSIPVFADEPAWREWIKQAILPADEAQRMMSQFVDGQLGSLPLPADREEWEQSRAHRHRHVLESLGLADLLPPSWDLNVTSRGVLERDGYKIEKLTYESYPGLAVPALLYVPDKLEGKVPGVVSIAGHVYGLGKAADFLQQRNVNLVRRGCVVLSYDYINTGERNTGEDPLHGKPYGGGNDHGHKLFSFSTRNPTGLEVLDAWRAVDVLIGRPEVDAERIGFTGESGGGNSTYWIAAVDARVKLAVPVSSVTTFDYWIRYDRNWDWHQRPWGIRRDTDIGTLLALHAPRPLLVISSLRGTDDDEFPLEEASKSAAWAEHVYRQLGAGNMIQHVESSTAHGYQEDKRRLLYAAVETHLNPPRPAGDIELPAQVESLDELRCGLPDANLTSRAIFERWVSELPRTIDGPQPGTAGMRAFLRERLGIPADVVPMRAESKGSLSSAQDKVAAEFLLIETERGIRLPAVLLVPNRATGPVVLVPGREVTAIAGVLEQNRRVLTFDMRGTGEIASGGRRFDNLAWFIGRPLTGMQAFDIQQMARFAATLVGGRRPVLVASHDFSWPVLLAAAAEPDLFDSGRVTLPFRSLRDQLDQPGYGALADVPGLLEHIDVPQLKVLWAKGDVVVD